MGKYPLDLGAFTVFPLAGLRFNIPLTNSIDGKNNSSFKVADAMNLGFQLGGGLDLPLSEALYLRASMLFNIDLFAPGDKPDGINADLSSAGPMIKAGVGYRF